VWAGGVSAPSWLAEPGVAIERARVVIDDDLRLARHPTAFAIGDVAAVRSRSGALHPSGRASRHPRRPPRGPADRPPARRPADTAAPLNGFDSWQGY
jgi:hypothetical protein